MKLALTALFAVLLINTSDANDGWAVYLGGEQSVRPHPQIRMIKEYITIDVGDHSAWVTCTFWFRNGGPSTSVGMAYPDESTSTSDGVAVPQLKDFRSSVDGKPVETQFQLIRNGGYRIKRVNFGPGQTRMVVNRYRIPLGSVASRGQVYVHDLHYTFSTGASWKGQIGRTELVTRFNGRFRPRRVLNAKLLESDGPRSFWKDHQTDLFQDGPTGKLLANEYRILRRNWRPTESDNVRLRFRPFTVDWSRGDTKQYLQAK